MRVCGLASAVREWRAGRVLRVPETAGLQHLPSRRLLWGLPCCACGLGCWDGWWETEQGAYLKAARKSFEGASLQR